jgi:ferritin-like metal-binding protein YciE
MARRLEAVFDEATEASLAAVRRDDIDSLLVSYVRDARAIEAQAEQILRLASKTGGDPELKRVYKQHLEETEGQIHLLEQRLEAHGASPSRLKDAGMRMGALNWGTFFQAQPDTTAKLAGFAYAFEHLEIGGYELLKRVAQRVGDETTAQSVDIILVQEHAMAKILLETFDRAVENTLEGLNIN